MNQIQNFKQGANYKTCSGQLILQGQLSEYTRDTALLSDSASDTVGYALQHQNLVQIPTTHLIFFQSVC